MRRTKIRFCNPEVLERHRIKLKARIFVVTLVLSLYYPSVGLCSALFLVRRTMNIESRVVQYVFKFCFFYLLLHEHN